MFCHEEQNSPRGKQFLGKKTQEKPSTSKRKGRRFWKRLFLSRGKKRPRVPFHPLKGPQKKKKKKKKNTSSREEGSSNHSAPSKTKKKCNIITSRSEKGIQEIGRIRKKKHSGSGKELVPP